MIGIAGNQSSLEPRGGEIIIPIPQSRWNQQVDPVSQLLKASLGFELLLCSKPGSLLDIRKGQVEGREGSSL